MTSWSNTSRNSSSWANAAVNSASWSTVSKSLSGLSYLLLENGFYLLQETGDKITLEQSSSTATSWANVAKS